MPRKPGNYSRFDAGKQEIFRCWCGVAGVIALLADSQNTPIRMAWAGWPQAGWNHAGRGSVPTQEEKFPGDFRSAFHAPIRKSGIPDPKTGKSFSDFAEILLTKHNHLAKGDHGFLVSTVGFDTTIAFSEFGVIFGFNQSIGNLNEKRLEVGAGSGNPRSYIVFQYCLCRFNRCFEYKLTNRCV